MTEGTPCPACRHNLRYKGYYLCFDCWGELPLPARRALKRKDMRAVERLRELHRQLSKQTPLKAVRITP